MSERFEKLSDEPAFRPGKLELSGKPTRVLMREQREAAKLMRDVTQEYERMRAQLLLIRVTLGLNPCQDALWAVQTLHAAGREEFEKLRGERCDWAHEWKPG